MFDIVNNLESLRGCPDCGQLNHLQEARAKSILECARCRKVLWRFRPNALETSRSFAVAACVFFLILATSPLLDVSLYGRFRSSTLHTGPMIFEEQRLWLLGAVLVVTTLAMPLLKLALTLITLIGLRMRNPSPIVVDCFRWAREVSKWAMLEVYLLGFLVAYTRLQSLVYIQIDVAVYALIGTILASAAMDALMDHESLWQEMEQKHLTREPSTDPQLPLLSCDICYKVSHSKPGSTCPRCRAVLHARKPNSLNRTWALAIAAIIFYIPANYFPVMAITRLGATTEHTIIGGMMEFIQAGMWPLALLIFVASIVIPMLKLVLLAYMLVQTHQGSDKRLLLRTRMYRLIDFIGRWSMVDVFMVSILIGLVRFGQIAEIRSGVGAACFAAVVILTILAVESMDSRLMWDAARRGRPGALVSTKQALA